MKAVIREEELDWIPHPLNERVKRKILLTKRDFNVDITCMLVKIERGLGIPEHIHENQDDILYPLSGKFRMWIDGIGEFEVGKNVMVRVPKGVKHRISEAYEDVVLLDIFSPAIL